MARLRTAYVRDADGRLRRDPAHEDRDLGPAAARSGDGLAAAGRLSVMRVSEYLQADIAQAAGAGPIERRPATPEDLARFEPAVPAPRPAARAIPAVVPTERHSGAERSMTSTSGNLAQPTRTPAPTPTRVEEEPVTEPVPATPHGGVLLPCTTCLHEPVCALKHDLPKDTAQLLKPAEIGPGLRLVTTGVRIECDHQLVSLRPVEPEPIRREHGGESWRTTTVTGSTPRRTTEDIAESRRRGVEAAAAARGTRYPLPKDPDERARVVFDALRSTDSLAGAAAVLQVSANRVSQLLTEYRRAGSIPADVEALLDARNPSRRGRAAL